MRWIWVGGSVAAACAVVAVALFLSDLETLSWIAGAGSFVVAVASLAVTLPSRNASDQRARTPGPAAASDPDGAGPETSPAAGGASPVVVELTTPRIRIAKRLASACKGAALAALTLFVGLGMDSITGRSLEHLSLVVLLQLYALVGGFMATLLFLTAGAEGKDLLIVDRIGLTIVDKRWIRAADTSFFIPWALVRHIRVEPSGACHDLVVEFEHAEDGSAERAQIDALKKRNKCPTYYYKCSLARLYVTSGGTERTALLHTMHTALTRFGGDACRE
ncbi:hypothetical protein AAH991_15860 [Microbispora sp. ZYX-F-249]|uniref:PH domain-containing protein n=1 Tax=Microbispora maris TaxID=3144104 RepID=A0ABV0AMS0_9ACTN